MDDVPYKIDNSDKHFNRKKYNNHFHGNCDKTIRNKVCWRATGV